MAGEFAGRLKVIEAELADVVSRLERLYEALETSQLTLEALSPHILNLRHRQDQLTAARDEAESQLEQRRVDLPGTDEIKGYVAASRGVQGGGQHWGRVSAEDRVIEGTVNAAYEAVVALPLRGPAGQARDVNAVVDTGFTRFLTLPPTMVAELGLGFRGVNHVILADGSEATLEVYGVTVLWDDSRP